LLREITAGLRGARLVFQLKLALETRAGQFEEHEHAATADGDTECMRLRTRTEALETTAADLRAKLDCAA
jgi:hypothetical protein